MPRYCRGVSVRGHWMGTREDNRSKLRLLPHQAEQDDSAKFIVLTLVSIVAVVGVLLASSVFYCLRHSSHHRLKEKLSGLGGGPGPDAPSAYQSDPKGAHVPERELRVLTRLPDQSVPAFVDLQEGRATELCRQRMAVRTSERPEAPHTSRVSSVSSQFSDGPMPSPSARSSTSSWSEEPVQPNMDISTGHMVLFWKQPPTRSVRLGRPPSRLLCSHPAALRPGDALRPAARRACVSSAASGLLCGASTVPVVSGSVFAVCGVLPPSHLPAVLPSDCGSPSTPAALRVW
ncbi:hypothetical protein CB1_001949001 [Camelus ferus]|nr:hypothetical protein CB1_001949001 [Camelus ferus]